jgi:hypothetical protein
MALRAPLVLGADGLPQQMQAGDTLANGGAGLATVSFPAAGALDAALVITGQSGIAATSTPRPPITPSTSIGSRISR